MKEIDFTGLVQLQPHIHRTLLMRTNFYESSPLCKIIIICAVLSVISRCPSFAYYIIYINSVPHNII